MRYLAGLFVLIVSAGCQKPSSAPSPSASSAPESTPVEKRTNWSSKSELFVEFPVLISGETSRFAVHVTRLDNFKPMAKADVEVRLAGQGGADAVFTADSPKRPGIFGVSVKAPAAAKYRLTVAVKGEGIADIHGLGEVTVYPTKQAIPAGADETPGATITFTKEQQWDLDYASATAEVRSLRDSLLVHGEVLPRTGGTADVNVPLDGRLVMPSMPVVGTRVTAGQVLAQVVAPAPVPGDVSGLELAKSEAALALQLARRDRERADRLVASGAAPAKRLEEARIAEATAEARLQAADARLAQFASLTAGDGTARGGKQIAVRAPMAGVIHEVLAVSGANVRAGDSIARIVDIDTVYVAAMVPEADVPAIRELSGAEVRLPNGEMPATLTKLISVGRVVDPKSRTVSVIYEANNRDHRLAVNQGVHVRLLSTSSSATPVAPDAAIVDDAGRPVVFLQVGGETFERRPVALGKREGALVQIVGGLRGGERVVVKGAHLVRLASLSSAVPAEGHVH